MLTKNHLLILTEQFCAAEKIAEGGLSKRMFNDGKRLGSLRRTNADIGSLRLARAIQWLSNNWPIEAKWPEDIKRPERGLTVYVPPKSHSEHASP